MKGSWKASNTVGREVKLESISVVLAGARTRRRPSRGGDAIASEAEQVDSPPSREWIERAESELRDAGHRSSTPRSRVLELIGSQSCVRSAHEIAAELRRRRKPVGVATVYRTIELLEEFGLLQRLEFAGGSARFEPALPGGEHHHHHVVCDVCERVTPFDDTELERAIAGVAGRLSHDIGHHDVVLHGRCPDCS